ncbi:hypothetical protein ACH5RR_001274 [Cinchona calisaya]|uniref:Uncharacterized protein n=1 Tax=Cinchona calisaya TaxID=153742 RepID=A0ABD3B325_9GENT
MDGEGDQAWGRRREAGMDGAWVRGGSEDPSNATPDQPAISKQCMVVTEKLSTPLNVGHVGTDAHSESREPVSTENLNMELPYTRDAAVVT